MITPVYEHPSDRRVTLEHLRVFAAIAQTGSFQEAGNRLARTQSAITQSVKTLESCLHCKLVERRQGHVTGLTEDGLRIFPEVVDIINRVDLLIQVAQRPELKGHISFGIPPSIGTAGLQNALSSCMALNKGLRVRLVSDMSHHLEEMLENGLLDAAIVNQGPPGAHHGTLHEVHTFPEESLVWVSNKKEHYDSRTEIPFIAFPEGSPWTEAAVKAMHDAGRHHYIAYLSSSYESICSAVSAGIGITALPLSNVSDSFVLLSEEDGLPPLPTIRTAIKARIDSEAVLEFCKLVEQLPLFSPPQQDQAPA